MITDLVQRRVSKRRDRFNPIYLLYLFIFAPLLLGLFFPEFERFLGEDLYIWILILIILALSLGINYFQWRAWHHRWRDFAMKMGLQYESYKSKQALFFQWPRIQGTYQGYALRIGRFTKGSGRYKKIYTMIVLGVQNPVSNTMMILPKSWSSGLRRSLTRKDDGLEYIELGDELFDRKLQVRASSAQFAQNVLSAHNIKQGLNEIRSQTRDLYIQVQGNELYFHERSNIMDVDYLADVISTLSELMGYIERYRR